jgi:hypothetical protein
MTLHVQLSKTLLLLQIVVTSVSLSVYSRTRIGGTITDLMSLVTDNGVVVNGLTDDFDGDSRSLGIACDIGADEYTSSSIINRIVAYPDPGIVNSDKKLYTKNLGFSCTRSTDNTILFNINGVYMVTPGKWLIIIKKDDYSDDQKSEVHGHQLLTDY